jgi:hypothetical protein
LCEKQPDSSDEGLFFTVTHMDVVDIQRIHGVLAYTGDSTNSGIAHASLGEEKHKITESKENGKCCAKVNSAAKIHLDVTTVYPNSSSVSDIITADGYQAIVEHEGRRQYAYVEGKKQLLTPISETGRIATRCGKICSKSPGSAKRSLVAYLDSNQTKAMDQFNAYQDKVQIDIDKENDPAWWITRDGKFDGFSQTVTVDSPPNIEWEDCPKSE